MSERNSQYEFPMGPVIAQASMAFGVLFCGSAVWAGIVQLDSGFLVGAMGISMIVANVAPTLAGGLLLIVAGHILRAVSQAPSE
jgi:hypothetical protein